MRLARAPLRLQRLEGRRVVKGPDSRDPSRGRGPARCPRSPCCPRRPRQAAAAVSVSAASATRRHCRIDRFTATIAVTRRRAPLELRVAVGSRRARRAMPAQSCASWNPLASLWRPSFIAALPLYLGRLRRPRRSPARRPFSRCLALLHPGGNFYTGELALFDHLLPQATFLLVTEVVPVRLLAPLQQLRVRRARTRDIGTRPLLDPQTRQPT